MAAHYEDKEINIYKVKCAPYDNNAYLLVCPKTNESIIIDTPADHCKLIRAARDVKGGEIMYHLGGRALRCGV